MLSKPEVTEELRKELPPSFLCTYDHCQTGGIGIPGDFFIEHMETLKKHGIYEHLLLYEYIEGKEQIINTKIEILHKIFSVCNRATLRKLCEPMPDERSEYTVYRGSTEDRKLGISWTLCQLHATHFAWCINEGAGRLYETSVLAPDVLAFFGEYFNEKELIFIPQSGNVSELSISSEVRDLMNGYGDGGFYFPHPDIMPDSCKDCSNKICLKLFQVSAVNP